jgi:hypothetical protein
MSTRSSDGQGHYAYNKVCLGICAAFCTSLQRTKGRSSAMQPRVGLFQTLGRGCFRCLEGVSWTKVREPRPWVLGCDDRKMSRGQWLATWLMSLLLTTFRTTPPRAFRDNGSAECMRLHKSVDSCQKCTDLHGYGTISLVDKTPGSAATPAASLGLSHYVYWQIITTTVRCIWLIRPGFLYLCFITLHVLLRAGTR